MTRLTVHTHRHGHRSIDELLARARLDRVDAAGLDAEIAGGAVVIALIPRANIASPRSPATRPGS